MIDNILHGRVSLTEPRAIWDEISGDAKALLTLLLSADPAVRPSAAKALEHAWFQSATTPRWPLLASQTDSLQQYQSRMKKKFRVLSAVPGHSAVDERTD
ncbi:hypothetical protein PINS_up013806 [Pythium insidiosum]|nr:hypothetical protein PINS_up013806 [Pythium insidiosum]